MCNTKMRAVVWTAYGPPEVLRVTSVSRPVLRRNEVGIRVKASAVNSADVRMRSLDGNAAMRLLMRLFLGVRRPRRKIPGVVVSGVVYEVGDMVTLFRPGDEVFAMTGMRLGGNAEYIALPESSAVELKPSNASFEEAAALPFGGTTAIYFLNKAGIGRGLSVLIYGATGSVGTAALQIARHYGAHVTAACSVRGESLVRSLGTDDVLVYDKGEVENTDKKFDIVFDAVGRLSRKTARSLLKGGGRFVTVGGLDVAGETKEQLRLLRKLYERSELRATIDNVYPLDEIVEAHRRAESGRKHGNVVIRL